MQSRHKTGSPCPGGAGYTVAVPFYPPIKHLSEAQRKRTAAGLLRLKQGFATEALPQKRVDGNLLLATWNLREFGGSKYGGRDKESLYYIAEIISRFDLVAVQELRAEMYALDELMRILGAWWKVLHTDVTAGTEGNRERTGFIYDSRKVNFGGLAGEIVLPPVKTATGSQPAQQIARTPMIVGLRAGWFKFTICTAHLFYGADKPDEPRRVKEVNDLAAFLRDAVEDKTAWANNMIVLGDFNIFTVDDETFKALANHGFTVPQEILKTTTNLAGGKHYDQIAFIAPSVSDQLTGAAAGAFNFQKYVYRDTDEAEYKSELNGQKYKTWRTYKMSDHLPLWVELRTDFGDAYLAKIAG